MKIVGTEAFKATYFQHCGSDLTPVQAAKVSTNKEVDTLDDRGRGLLKYLADHLHMTPFEMIDLTLIIECPIFIRSQVHRHRTFSYNEWSGMYSEVGEAFYVPKEFHIQGKKALSLSKDVLDNKISDDLRNRIEIHVMRSYELYRFLLDTEVTRDLSRLILPQNMMTKFFMKGNLRAWMGFCALRCADDAHYEHQFLADLVFHQLIKMFPVCVGHLGRNMFPEHVRKRLGIYKEEKK